MFVNTIYRRILFVSIFLFIFSLIIFYFFFPIFTAKSVIIPYSLNNLDICKNHTDIWLLIKHLFIIFHFLAGLIYSNYIYSRIFTKSNSFKTPSTPLNTIKSDSLNLLIGKDLLQNNIYLPESSLYQNILITGTIGTGKTSSAMYPFTRQLIEYNHSNQEQKLGMLILDVKGNYYKKVYEYAKHFNRLNDLVVIELGSNIKYNPLDKPFLRPSVLANRLKTILTLFSKNNSESYWLDKAETILRRMYKTMQII